MVIVTKASPEQGDVTLLMGNLPALALLGPDGSIHTDNSQVIAYTENNPLFHVANADGSPRQYDTPPAQVPTPQAPALFVGEVTA